MANGIINLGTSGQIEGRITWSSSSNGTSANSSQVTATIQVRRTNSYTTTGTWTGNLNIGGENQGFSVHSAVTNSWVTMKSFTITKAHNPDGTGSCYIQGGINGPSGTSQAGKNVNGAQTVTLDKIDRFATLTSAPNFTDIQNPTIQYSNPAGNSVTTLKACISLTGAKDDIKYRDISKTGSSYTFNLTEEERNVLRNATPNSKTLTVKFYITSVINGQTDYSILDRTMTIVNANPTFNMSYLDTNNKTTEITENDQLIIRNNSHLQIQVSKPVAYKGATINDNSSCTIEILGQSYLPSFVLPFQSTTKVATVDVGIIDTSQDTTAKITVTDSRGFSTTKELKIKVLNWTLPSALFTMQRVSNFYSTTNFKVDASYSSLNNKNTLQIQYQIKKRSDASYGTLTTIENNTETTFEADNLYEWNVKVILTDKIGTATYNLVLNKGIPIIFFDDLLNSTGFNCFPKVENSVWSSNLPVDDVREIGSQVLYDSYQMTSSGENKVLGTYDARMLTGLFDGIEIPEGYERGYRITAQVSTYNSNYASVKLNNFESSKVSTWSAQTFRQITSTRIFKESEIEFEDVLGYESNTRKGVNIYCCNSDNYNAYFWNITVHGYIVKKANDLLPSLDTYVRHNTETIYDKAIRLAKAKFETDFADGYPGENHRDPNVTVPARSITSCVYKTYKDNPNDNMVGVIIYENYKEGNESYNEYYRLALQYNVDITAETPNEIWNN